MGEFEDKINGILSSPEQMEKIMGMAKALSSGGGDASSPPLTGLDGIDPKTVKIMNRILSQYPNAASDKAALLNAFKPYLKEDRREKIDRAVEITKLAKMARVVFSELSGGDNDV